MKDSFSTVRIQEITLENFKSTTLGTLTMPSVIRKQWFDYQPDILGIYGQNGTGKSAVVEALYLIRGLLAGISIQEDYERFIAQGSETCTVRVKFLVSADIDNCSFDYSVTLARKKPSVDDSSSQSVFISEERLHCAEWNMEENKFMPRVLLFHYNSVDYEKFTPKGVYNCLLKASPDHLVKIAMAFGLAQHDRTSMLSNARFVKLINEGRDIGSQQERRKLALTVMFCSSMVYYSVADLFVITNELCSLSQGHHYVSFYIRQHCEGRRALKNVFIGLQRTDLISLQSYELIQSSIDSINIVLASIIPQLQIALEHHGEEIDSEGERKVRVQLLSVRGDVRLPLQDESTGIIKIISILSALLHVYHHAGACLVVDELDSGIFEYLLGELLQIFEREAKGQIIFTSHNLRALEMLHKDSLIFSTTNADNRYIRMKSVKPNNNLRDVYYRSILLGGQEEELYAETDSAETARAFRLAGKKLEL